MEIIMDIKKIKKESKIRKEEKKMHCFFFAGMENDRHFGQQFGKFSRNSL